MKYVLELSVESSDLKELIEISNNIQKTLRNRLTGHNITVTRREDKIIYSNYVPKSKD